MSRQAGLKFKLFSRRRSDNPLNVPSKQTTCLMFPIIILKEDKVSILISQVKHLTDCYKNDRYPIGI